MVKLLHKAENTFNINKTKTPPFVEALLSYVFLYCCGHEQDARASGGGVSHNKNIERYKL